MLSTTKSRCDEQHTVGHSIWEPHRYTQIHTQSFVRIQAGWQCVCMAVAYLLQHILYMLRSFAIIYTYNMYAHPSYAPHVCAPCLALHEWCMSEHVCVCAVQHRPETPIYVHTPIAYGHGCVFLK